MIDTIQSMPDWLAMVLTFTLSVLPGVLLYLVATRSL